MAADSNGGFHPLGDHADTSFSVDNQPITDQQSRTFSNQLSQNAIQSLDVLTGVPPAEFGDKTSLIVKATTRSGLGASPTDRFPVSGVWIVHDADGLVRAWRRLAAHREFPRARRLGQRAIPGHARRSSRSTRRGTWSISLTASTPGFRPRPAFN